MRFESYTDWEQLPESANALFAQAEKDSIFFSRPWFENLTKVLDDDLTVVFFCVVAENKMLAMLPLVKTVGNSFISLKHAYGTHYNLLLAAPEKHRKHHQTQQQVLTCLVHGLEQLPARSLLLEPVADDDASLVGLQDAMGKAGYRCERYFRFYNWIVRLQGQSFTSYMADRPARLRNTISRKKRKLQREHGFDIRLFTGTDVLQAMPDYYAVYSASWKANEQYVDFLNGIVEGFSDPGWARLGVLYVKGQAVAAQLWFVHAGKASIFRLSYDEAWKHYSPGSILTHFLMEYVIDIDKVEEIDFLTGNESYKQDWMSERRERLAVSFIKEAKPTGWYERLVLLIKRLLKK